MATVTGLTAARMIAMENQTIIDGNIVGDNLILVTRAGTNINAGNVRGPMGPSGSGFTICTSTTRPTGLVPADEGKVIYETDTDLVRIWTGTRWRLQEKIICTSTTRPAGLGGFDEGVQIYETDTEVEFTWSGTSWVLSSRYETFLNAAQRTSRLASPLEGSMSYLRDVDALEVYAGSSWKKPWNMSWGILFVAQFAPSSPFGIKEVTLIPGCISTLTYPGGRHVKLSGHTHGSSSTQAIYWVTYIREGSTGIVAAYDSTTGPMIPASNDPFIVIQPTPGPHTYSLACATGSDGGFMANGPDNPATFLIEDIGPVEGSTAP